MIRSTIPARYTLRSAEEAVIEIAITNWRYEPLNHRYVATVEDYAVITDLEGNESRQRCNTKEVYYSTDQINGLFTTMENTIYPTENFSDELVRLIAGALLYVTQTDLYSNGTTIYGLQPNEWVINSDYAKMLKNEK